MEKILSSIVLVYNTEKYFNRCMDSIISSIHELETTNNNKDSSEKIEIIIINDGSQGNIDNLVKPYINKYKSYIKYYKNENMGRSKARNFGISKSSGKYISFIDSDDEIDKNYYPCIIKQVEENNGLEMLIFDIKTIENNNSKRTHAKNLNIEDDKWGCIDISIMPSPCNKIIFKEKYQKYKFPDEINFNYEDLATTLLIFLNSKNIKYIPIMYYYYHINNDSIMHREFNKENFKIIFALDYLFKRIDNLDISIKEKEKAKFYVTYERIYFELIDKISQMPFKLRYKYGKIFIQKIKQIMNYLNNNSYYLKYIKNGGRKKRLLYSYILNICIKYKLYLIFSLFIKKISYYELEYRMERRKFDD